MHLTQNDIKKSPFAGNTEKGGLIPSKRFRDLVGRQTGAGPHKLSLCTTSRAVLVFLDAGSRAALGLTVIGIIFAAVRLHAAAVALHGFDGPS